MDATDKNKKIDISYVPEDEDIKENEEKIKQKTSSGSKKKTSSNLKKLQKKMEEQEEILKKVIAEKDDFKDKYLRNLAEIDNFRKRMKKEKEDYQKYFLSEFLLNLLEIFDNLERALQAQKSEDKESIVSGVQMIHKQLIDLLKKYKTVEVEAKDKPFDPNFHQALSKEEQEECTEPTVAEVYQKGFMYNDKLLRPALVKVAIPAEPVPDTVIEKG